MLYIWIILLCTKKLLAGVDSLLAPFVVLNFNDEARAFWCLQRIVDKFLHNVLLHKDEVNNSNLQERLVLFQQILAYHDPVLANHLNDIGFKPELYAIPWFLTLFTRTKRFLSILFLCN